MKRISIVLTALVIIASTQLLFGAGKNVNTCVNLCGGYNVSCKDQKAACDVGNTGGLLNFFKDRVEWNTTKARYENLGIINQQRKANIILPNAGQMKVVALTPADGPLADQQIQVLFVAFDVTQPLTSNVTAAIKKQLNFMNNKLTTGESSYHYLTKVYRKIQGERQWVEMFDIASADQPGSSGMALAVTIAPTGTVITNQPIYVTEPNGNQSTISAGVTIDLAAPL